MIKFTDKGIDYFKTVVTEIKSYIVDSKSKVALYKQTVSAAISNNHQYEKTEFNVSLSEHYTVNSFNNLFHISTLEPVKVIMMGLGESPEFEDDNSDPDVVYNTAKIFNHPTVVAGESLRVRVTDPDIPEIVTSIGAIAYNANSGETENITLLKIGVGVFEGTIDTNNSFDVGNNFDGSLNCYVGQVIQIIYSDSANANKRRENITSFANVLSPTKTAEIETRNLIMKGKPVPIIIKDDANTAVVPIYIQNISTGISKIIDVPRIKDGEFGISIPTVEFNGFNSFNDDGSMGIENGHVLRLTYTDTNDVRGNTTTITKDITIVGGIDEIAKFYVSDTVYQSDSLDIIMEDYDSTGKQLAVTVSNLQTGKYTVIVLQETISGSGVFEGKIEISSVPITNTNNTGTAIYAQDEDELNIVFVDNAGTLPVSKKVTVYEKPTADPLPDNGNDPDDEPDEEPLPSANTGVTELLINQAFVINGRFKGLIRIEGTKQEPTRCTLLVS